MTNLKNKLPGQSKSYYSTLQDESKIWVTKNIADKYAAEYLHIGELLGGTINKSLSGRKNTPETFMSCEKDGKNVKILSTLLCDAKYQDTDTEKEQSVDLAAFFNNKIEDKKKGIKLSNLYINQRAPSKEERPIKGLFESLLIRIFLGDRFEDLKFENLIITYQKDHYQIENVDFGSAFQVVDKMKLPIDQRILDKRYLIENIEEIRNTDKYLGKDSDKVVKSYTKFLLDKIGIEAAELEIKTTLEKIQQLSDNNLESWINKIRSINSTEITLVPKRILGLYLEYLKVQREKFQRLKITI